MVGDILQPTHLLFVLLVALLVLGPKRLPEVGKTLGAGIRDFRQAISGEADHNHHEPLHTTTTELRHEPPSEPEPAATVAEAPVADESLADESFPPAHDIDEAPAADATGTAPAGDPPPLVVEPKQPSA